MTARVWLRVGCLAAGLCSLHNSASAAFVTADYEWRGDAGWLATGVARFDDAEPMVRATGPAWGAMTTGLDYLDLSIFDPTGQRLGSWVQVLDGVALYNTLRITIDTDWEALAGASKLDMGNTLVRSAYLGGTEGLGLAIMWNYRIVDRGPGTITFDVRESEVSLPGSSGLVALGLVYLTVGGRRARRS